MTLSLAFNVNGTVDRFDVIGLGICAFELALGVPKL
jgi:hypothetical protein